MSDIIDINVFETIEEVTINVTDNLITVNINKVTGGGGGTQTLAQTLVLGNITDGENISISNGDAIILDNGSMLKKGTIDAGNGGSKGISQICGVGFEHKWEAGRLYIMNDGGTIIREVSHNLTYTPTVTDDVTKGFVQNTRWILDNGDVYICTDPTEDAAVWELVNTGTTPTLQQVTDEGNETTNDVIVKDTENKLSLQPRNIRFFDIDDGGDTNLKFINTSAVDQEIEIRGLGGTMALTSDIPTLVAGTNISIDDTDPLNPIISSSGGSVTSVGLTMPSAFSVTNSPITSSGDIAVTGAGLVSQYVRGDGTLANFPASTGGGASLSFYLNGSVSQGTIGGVAFKEMDRTPILGAGTDFTINANGYIQSFITDANVPNLLEIPAGNWNFETYFSASSGGGSPSFYVELYKWNGTTLSLIASNSATPEGITNGTAIDAYFSALAVPQTTLLATDRLAVRIYVTHSGRTITLHTEDNHLCQVITTFSTGITALNGLTAQVQNLAVGTSGTDFAISSATDTHTFNLPTASASNRGALSSTDWSTFNGKQNALGFTAENVANKENTTLDTSTSKYPTNRLVKEYADAKVADSITDGVTTIAPSQNAVFDALALKQAALSFIPYRNVQTSQTALTGTTGETPLFTATIPANSFNSSDVIKVLFGANKTTALGTFTIRLRVNTTNTLSGASTIAIYNGTATAQMDIMMRNFNLNGGNLYGLAPGSSSLTDILASGTGLASTSLNPANTFYIFATVQLTNASDSIIGNMLSIHN